MKRIIHRPVICYRRFVKRLLSEQGGLERARQLYDGFKRELINLAANKQALSAALILTADALTEEWIFKDGVRLTAEQLAVYLKKDTDIDTNDRALTRICQWIYENEKQFTADREFKYGKITRSGRRRFWAIRTLEFENMMDRFRYNVESFKTWAIANDYMDVDPGRKDKTVRINGRTARCVCIVYETEADNITPIDAFDREA